MSKLNTKMERLSGASRSAAFRSALVKLTPMVLAAVLAGCATKGEHSSALNHSGSSNGAADAAGRGYNASASHAPDSTELAADGSRPSSTQGGAVGRRGARGSNSAGAHSGPDTMNSPSGSNRASSTGMAEGDGVDDDQEQDSSLADGTPGASKAGRPGARGSRARNSGGAIAGAEGTSTDGVAGVDSESDGTTAGKKGKRGAGVRRRGGGAPGSDGESGTSAPGDEGSDTRIAAIEVPNSNVYVNEDYQPLTLGGALPVVLGVNEEGRFDFDQYALRDEVKAILDGLADTLKTAEYDRLDIFGYTDRIGAVDYNRRLSELRAYAVAQYLMRRGVPESKIRYEGRGDMDPLTQADECQGLAREELITCLQKDRRVEIEASIHRKHATIVQ